MKISDLQNHQIYKEIPIKNPTLQKGGKNMMSQNEKHRSTLTSLVKANYQIAEITGNWDNNDLIKYLTELVLEQEKEIRRLQRS